MSERRDAGAAGPGDARDATATSCLAATAFALAATTDPAALVDVCGEAARAAAGGRAWRFYALDPENGALRDGSPAGSVVLAAPGGALEWLLLHEAPLLRETPDPSLAAAWPAPPRALLGLPVRSGSTLRGVLLVALDGVPAGGLAAPGVAAARVVADQCALALERQALAVELARERERIAVLEVKAHAGEELFNELISVVAHEIRTPLTSIKAYTETLIDAPADEFERRREFLHVIDEECDRLARLVGDALDLSRLEARLRLLKVKPLSPRALLDDLALTVEPDAQRHGVKLRVEADDAPDEVEADGDLVKQLLLNLVGNAIKFSPRDTTVTLRAARDAEDAWTLAVLDQGGGIPEALLERIFERFYRIETKDGRRAPGTGLGLAIARHIVDLHGGQLAVANAPTGGSVFTARLPLRQLAPLPVRAIVGELIARPGTGALLEAAVATIAEVMQAEIVSILLVDPGMGDLGVAASRGLEEQARARRMHYRGGVTGAVLAAGRPVLVENIETDRRFAKKSHPQYSTKSLLCAPLQVGGVNVGTVNVNNKRSRQEFDDRDLGLLTSLVSRLSAFLSRAHAYPDAPEVLAEARASVESVARVKRDLWLDRPELARHAHRIAGQLGADAATCAAVAHLATAAAASPFAGDATARAAARAVLLARAERLDGSGWPRGLRAGAIPLGARVLAVIDAFESLTQGRPYRTALTVDEALAALRAQAGRQFDGDVVEALAASLRADGWTSDAREEAA